MTLTRLLQLWVTALLSETQGSRLTLAFPCSGSRVNYSFPVLLVEGVVSGKERGYQKLVSLEGGGWLMIQDAGSTTGWGSKGDAMVGWGSRVKTAYCQRVSYFRILSHRAQAYKPKSWNAEAPFSRIPGAWWNQTWVSGLGNQLLSWWPSRPSSPWWSARSIRK